MAQPADPTTELLDGVERFLAALPDPDFAALVARVRAPADGAQPQAEPSPTEYPGGWNR